MEELEKNRDIIVLTVENFHGYVRGKYAIFPMLMKNLGQAVPETEKTYRFNKESREFSLTQYEEVESVFPAYLALLYSATGQILIDQMFHMPKNIEMNFMSVPFFENYAVLNTFKESERSNNCGEKMSEIRCIHSLTRTEWGRVERKVNNEITMITFSRGTQTNRATLRNFSGQIFGLCQRDTQ